MQSCGLAAQCPGASDRPQLAGGWWSQKRGEGHSEAPRVPHDWPTPLDGFDALALTLGATDADATGAVAVARPASATAGTVLEAALAETVGEAATAGAGGRLSWPQPHTATANEPTTIPRVRVFITGPILLERESRGFGAQKQTKPVRQRRIEGIPPREEAADPRVLSARKDL